MTDPALIAAISGGAAILGGAIGAGASSWTTVHSLKVQADEDRVRQRKDIYLGYLDSAHEFMHSAALPNVVDKSQQEWSDWFRDFERKLTAVQILGSKKVRREASSLKDAIGDVLGAVAGQSGDTMEERRRNAYESQEKNVMKAYDNTIDAMREDVGLGK